MTKERFVNTDVNIVEDTKTGFEWLTQNFGRMTYKRAVSVCEQIKESGYNWRLPTIKELEDLFKNPIDSIEEIFPNIINDNYWSGEKYAGNEIFILYYDVKEKRSFRKERILTSYVLPIRVKE